MMKYALLLILLLVGISYQAFQKITLKITYDKQPVIGHNITISNGDTPIGKGVTDSKGIVTIQANLMSDEVDVYGYIILQNSKKEWEIKNHVKLNEEFNAHLELLPYVEETSEQSENNMSVQDVALLWGLVSYGGNKEISTSQNHSSAPPAKLTLEEEKGYESKNEETVIYGSSHTYRDEIEKNNKEEKSKNKLNFNKAKKSLKHASLEQQINAQNYRIDTKKKNLDKNIEEGNLTPDEITIKLKEIELLELKRDQNEEKLRALD